MTVVQDDRGVTSPLGTALTIGIVILMAIGLSFMVRVFLDDRNNDPQELATFQTDEVQDSLTVRRADQDTLASEFEVRLSVAGDFDTVPVTAGSHALAPNQFAQMGDAPGGPANVPMVANQAFYFCASGGPAQAVQIDIRHTASNSVIWRGTFNELAACP
jgi:hypothetical protein